MPEPAPPRNRPTFTVTSGFMAVYHLAGPLSTLLLFLLAFVLPASSNPTVA